MTTIQGVPDLGPGLRLHLNENTGGCSQKVVDAVRAFDGPALATYPDFTKAVIETTPDKMESLIAGSPELQKHIGNEWVQLALLDPDSNRMWTYHRREFTPYEPESKELEAVESSVDWYRGWRDHLGFALVRNGMKPIADVNAAVDGRSNS